MNTQLEFVRVKLSDPAVVLADVAAATGVSRRSLSMMKRGEMGNAWVASINSVARYFGYRFEAVPLKRRRRRGASAVTDPG